MLYKFKQGHNVAEATKKIYCVEGKGTVDHSTITSWLKKFHLLQEPQKSGKAR